MITKFKATDESSAIKTARKLTGDLGRVLDGISAIESTKKTERLVALLRQALDEISNLVKKDPDGKRYPGLWALHSDICQAFDEMGE